MAAGLSATQAGAQPRPPGDPIAGKIVINTQGGFTDYNEKRRAQGRLEGRRPGARQSGAGAAGEADGLPFTDELLGPDQFRVFARVMARRGHSQARIDKVLGLNWLRYARETWAPDGRSLQSINE